MINPINPQNSHDHADEETVPVDQSNLHLQVALDHLKAAQEAIHRAMRFRAELEVALYFEPGRLAGIARTLRGEMK